MDLKPDQKRIQNHKGNFPYPTCGRPGGRPGGRPCSVQCRNRALCSRLVGQLCSGKSQFGLLAGQPDSRPGLLLLSNSSARSPGRSTTTLLFSCARSCAWPVTQPVAGLLSSVVSSLLAYTLELRSMYYFLR